MGLLDMLRQAARQASEVVVALAALAALAAVSALAAEAAATIQALHFKRAAMAAMAVMAFLVQPARRRTTLLERVAPEVKLCVMQGVLLSRCEVKSTVLLHLINRGIRWAD